MTTRVFFAITSELLSLFLLSDFSFSNEWFLLNYKFKMLFEMPTNCFSGLLPYCADHFVGGPKGCLKIWHKLQNGMATKIALRQPAAVSWVLHRVIITPLLTYFLTFRTKIFVESDCWCDYCATEQYNQASDMFNNPRKYTTGFIVEVSV